MKFKKVDDDVRGFKIKEKGGYTLDVETRADGKPGIFVSGCVYLTRSQALKLAWAIIQELGPS
jgi:hypothetical protein